MTELEDLLPEVEQMVEENEDGPEVPEAPIFTALHPLSEKDREKLFDEVHKRFTDSLQYMPKIWDKCIENYKKYRGIMDPILDEDGNEVTTEPNLNIPYTYAMVESSMPRLAGKLPRTRAFPRTSTNTAKAEVVQDAIYYALDRSNWLQKQIMWIRQFEMYGWSPLYYFWHVEYINGFTREKDPMTGEYVAKKIEIKKWDDWDCRVLDVFDCFMQPGVMDIQCSGSWFMFREYLSTKDVKDRVKAGIFYPEIGEYIKDHSNPGSKLSANDSGRGARDVLAGFHKDVTETAWGKHELIYMLEDNRIVTMLNQEIIASSGDNPEPRQIKPIVNCNLMEQVSEPIGIGSIEAMGGLQDKLNALSNARLKAIALTIDPMYLYDRNAMVDVKSLKSVAGGIVPTGNMEGVERWEMGDISNTSQQEIDETKDDIQFALGISAYHNVGSDDPGTETATGITTIVREGNARFALKLSAFEARPMRDVVESIHAYNVMYMPEEKQIRVLGPKGWMMSEIKLEDILCECDFVIEPGSSVPLDQLTRREALVSLLDRVIALPQTVDIHKYMKDVLDAHDIRNSEDFLLAAPEDYSQYSDVKLAGAENIAIGQGQDVKVEGNDEIHLQIHYSAMQNGDTSKWSPESQQKLQDHIMAHNMKIQQRIQYAQQISQNQLFGGASGGNQGTSGEVGTEQPSNPGMAQAGTQSGSEQVQ